jgi:hypothetical protein
MMAELAYAFLISLPWPGLTPWTRPSIFPLLVYRLPVWMGYDEPGSNAAAHRYRWSHGFG